MECADNATLNHGPEAINIGSMNRPADIFTLGVMDNAMVTPRIEISVTGSIISRDQADFMGNGLVHKGFKGFGINVINYFRHDLAATAHGPNNRSFPGRTTATPTLITMLVFGLATDKSFVNFHKADKFTKLSIVKSCPDTVAHRPCRTVRSCADHPVNLQGANTLLLVSIK